MSSRINQNKKSVSNVSAGVVSGVSASAPLCSSAGTNPNITFCGSIGEGSVTNLTLDLSNRVLKAGDTMTGQLNMSNAAVNATGANGNLVCQASMTTVGGAFMSSIYDTGLSVIGGTETIKGQDASGNSLTVSSNIVTGGCITFPSGKQCQPTATGAAGTPGTTGSQGPAGQNGTLTFASDIANFWIITSTSGKTNWTMSVDTDGAIRMSSTTTSAYFYAYSNVNKKYLSNGSFTSLITVDDVDGVLRMKSNTVTLQITDLAIADQNGVVWDIGMSSDGVIFANNSGSL